MKKIKRWIINQIKMFYGRFWPLTWCQDLRFVNDGYDIILFGRKKDGYFSGTVAEWQKFMHVPPSLVRKK